MSSGLHLGNNSRGSKITFYESKGGNGVKIGVRKHMASRGSGGMPPRKFLNSRLSQIFWCIFRYLTWVRMTRSKLRLLLFLMHSQVQFSATVLLKWSIWYKLCTYKHTASVTHTHMHFNQYYRCCWIWDFNLNFCLKLKGGQEFIKEGWAPPCAPLKWSPGHDIHRYIVAAALLIKTNEGSNYTS